MKRSRRYGNFNIPHVLMHTKISEVFDIMQHCIVLRAEYLAATDCFQYTAWSPYFDEVPEGMIIPEYSWIIDTDEGTLSVVKS